MPIPDFREDGWLPEGHHPATLEEVRDRFGGPAGSRRAEVMARLASWTDSLRRKKFTGTLLLDGGFVSASDAPSDFDVLFVYDDHVEKTLEDDPEAASLLSYSDCKAAGFDMLPFPRSSLKDVPATLANPLEVWDLDGTTKAPKGVLEIAL